MGPQTFSDGAGLLHIYCVSQTSFRLTLIMYRLAALIFYLFNSVYGQQIGTLTAEVAPNVAIQQCYIAGYCVTQTVSLTLDASWRWAHGIGTSTSCFAGNAWNAVLCPDPITCAANCGLDGADYAGTYGIATSGNAVSLHFKTGTNVGSRVFFKSSDTAYQLFKLKNQEFTFDVDLSNVPCGVKTDIYFVGMDADGGLAKYPTNKAGAKYGTGYCDASCPHNVKWINGQVNSPSRFSSDRFPEHIPLRRPIY
jgi:cellulose 1,4-beta-cellobiosidase